MILNKPLPDLADLLGSYFHQDWETEYRNKYEAVEAYIHDFSQYPGLIQRAYDQLHWLLDQHLSESVLQQVINEDLESFYWANGASEVFLKGIYAHLASRLGIKSSPPTAPQKPPEPSATPPKSKSSYQPVAQQTLNLNTDNLFRDLIKRPLLTGILCWFVLGASSCFKISWVRLYDFSYKNDFFSLSIRNDGWYYGFLIGVVAGLIWGILRITKHDSLGRIVAIVTIAVMGFALVKLPISGRWSNTSYEDRENSFSAIKNARATAVRFYQVSNHDVDTPAEKRNYTTRFKMAKQRIYIKFQLDLQHQAPGKRVDFKLDVLLRRYDSKRWVEVGWMHPVAYVDASWTNSNFVNGWGLANKGKYEADFYIDGKGIALGTFEIY